jgi:uncharacterized protein YoxC
MSGGGIAAIIAASGLFIIAIAISYAVFRLSRAIDEVRTSVRLITEDTTPLLEEATTTVRLVNGPLQSVNNITKAAEELTVKVSGAASSFLDKNAIAVKLLGTVLSAATKKKSSAKSSQSRKSSAKTKGKRNTYNEDEEF